MSQEEKPHWVKQEERKESRREFLANIFGGTLVGGIMAFFGGAAMDHFMYKPQELKYEVLEREKYVEKDVIEDLKLFYDPKFDYNSSVVAKFTAESSRYPINKLKVLKKDGERIEAAEVDSASVQVYHSNLRPGSTREIRVIAKMAKKAQAIERIVLKIQ